MKYSKVTRLVLLKLFLLILVGGAFAQDDNTDTTNYIRLKIPSVTRGHIGGESQEWYRLRLRKGQTVQIKFNWKKVRETSFNWSFSTSSKFQEFKQVKFGKYSRDGRSWTGTSPITRTYYLHTTAHPDKKYTLSISTVKRR